MRSRNVSAQDGVRRVSHLGEGSVMNKSLKSPLSLVGEGKLRMMVFSESIEDRTFYAFDKIKRNKSPLKKI